jgi:DNA-binding MarR family transcriptional regulator
MQLSVEGKQTGSSAPSTLAAQLAGFFRYVTLTCDNEFLHEVAELDLSLTQLKILSHLYELPAEEDPGQELSVKELGEQLGISLPATSRALDPLVRRRMAARKEDTEDRRVKRVWLTRSGKVVLERLHAKRVASFEAVLEQFTAAERAKLAAALGPIASRPEIQRHTPRKAAG